MTALAIEVGGNSANNQRITATKNVKIEYVANLQGAYAGPASGLQGSTQFNRTLTLEITQEGKVLSGSWAIDDGGPSGTMSGTIVGEDVKAALSLVIPCTGLLNVSATISDNGLSFEGHFQGTTYCVGDMEADFSVKRK